MNKRPISSITSRSFLAQLLSTHRLRRCLLFAVAPAIACYGLTLKLLVTTGFSVREAIRDPAQLTETSSWLGLISNLGVLMTVSAAVISLFVVSVIVTKEKKQQRECLFLMGLLSSLLAIDDFFLLHDRHIGEHTAYVTYAFCLSMLLYRHARTIVKVDGPAFLAAGGLLALSVFSDVFQGAVSVMSYDQFQVIEEGFKFVGMATWLYFSYRMAVYALSPYTASGTER